MVRPGKTAIIACVSALFGAAIGGLAVHGLTPTVRYTGLPVPLDASYLYNSGTVGPRQTFSGVWIDGFEDSRFFPGLKSLDAERVPETTARLQMSDANLIHRFIVKPVEPGCADVLLISFEGNAVKPRYGMPGYIETIYVPTDVLSVRSLRHIC